MRSPGHPKKDEVIEESKMILFKADKATLEKLRDLEAAEGRPGRRSFLIRKGIDELWKQLPADQRVRKGA
jgi:hypothetical protein